MICVCPDEIPKIDEYAEKKLNVSTVTLMGRAGAAVAREALAMTENAKSPRILILCGGGNNGGDGYAAAPILIEKGACVTVVDVFGAGQRSEAGRHYLAELEKVQKPISLDDLTASGFASLFRECDLIIDAILGTGSRRELALSLYTLADMINNSPAAVLAVDVPLGVRADDGTLADSYVKADKTLMLSYPKIGLYSYPAKEACGELLCDGIGINGDIINTAFELSHNITDAAVVGAMLPPRAKNSHKGTFGAVGMLCGSDRYRGAAVLCAHAALRMGAGIVRLVSDASVCDASCPTLPEVIYSPISYENDTPEKIIEKLTPSTAILVGCGCGVSDKLYTIVCNLLKDEGCPIILDADALNAIAKYGTDILKKSKRQILITPHPAEMARLCDITTAEVSANRLNIARDFSREYGVITLLKGASTVITDGERVMINTRGNSSLAKGGSGDVLAGGISSLAAQKMPLFESAVCGAYLHARAGEKLSLIYSEYGVRPSDLPLEMAKIIRDLQSR